MFGFFEDARIDITPVANTCVLWAIAATEVSYQIHPDGVITLRIDTRVKREADEQTKSQSDQSITVAAAPAPAMKRRLDDHLDNSEVMPVTRPDDDALDIPSARAQRTQVSPTGGGRSCAARRTADHISLQRPAPCADRAEENRQIYYVDERAKFAQGVVTDNDLDHQSASTRCSRQGNVSVRICCVEGCVAYPRGIVSTNDQHGHAGPRCLHHGAPVHRCAVEGCARFARGKIAQSDHHGGAGHRCLRHGAPTRRCNVEGCVRFGQGKVSENDCHGEAGTRCMRHNALGRQCNVNGCSRMAKGKAWRKDQHGQSGPRCRPHGACTGRSKVDRCARFSYGIEPHGVHQRVPIARQCNVDGCAKFRQGRVSENDHHGSAGKRCFQHGAPARRCNVDGCAALSTCRITKHDHFGPMGRRCTNHRGPARASR
eukprot:GEMP01023846.1.p1 GENE.GEMP01023846.1~~GEMP01023846.1.p1  ORF type:complete len:429 (+),score=82.97 GEMP01023846.1:174-1460(+)